MCGIPGDLGSPELVEWTSVDSKMTIQKKMSPPSPSRPDSQSESGREGEKNTLSTIGIVIFTSTDTRSMGSVVKKREAREEA